MGRYHSNQHPYSLLQVLPELSPLASLLLIDFVSVELTSFCVFVLSSIFSVLKDNLQGISIPSCMRSTEYHREPVAVHSINSSRHIKIE